MHHLDRYSRPRLLTLVAGLAALATAGCATTAAAPVIAASASSAAATAGAAAKPPTVAASGAAAAAPPPALGQPPAFATVIKDAKKTDGLLPIWRKDDKVWLEIPQALFDKPLLYSVNVSRSLGERGLVGSTMGRSWLVSFARPVTTQVQLLALNTDFVASGVPQQHGLAQNFSRSLLASMSVSSAPHPESKAVLVDAGFLLADIASYGSALERAFRLSYSPDRGNSHIDKAYATPEATTLGTQVHFTIPRLPLPPTGPVPPGVQLPTPPTTLPDARSLFVGFVHSFAKLPDQPMVPRKADGRIGHFTDTVTDFSSDRNLVQRVNYINRWRLEKKDPQAELSEPVKPITFWLDKNIPLDYRDTVKAGILEWNKAFEKIGFKNAIVVQQQSDDAEWDTLDATHASVRWYYTVDAGASATGPHHSDPRSGEILDADIRIGDGWTRVLRRSAIEEVGALRDGHDHDDALASGRPQEFCDYAAQALSELQFSLDALFAFGDLTPGSAEADAFVKDNLKHVVTHEVGHTLGLKHNFKASTVYTLAQLRDAAFTAANGITSSVMDYTPTNLALPGEPRAELFERSIGPYDQWAIEYAYRPFEPAAEAEALERIASRSTEPLLAFADDADAGFGSEGVDPLANRFDLGGDPLAFVERRIKLTRELWRRAQAWQTQPGEGSLRQRSMLGAGFGQFGRAADVAAKFIGGMHTVREVPGTPAAASRKAAFVPVESAQQRRALEALTQGLFNADSFRFEPRFVANLAPDYVAFERRAPVSVSALAMGLQTTVLDRLMSGGTAARLLDLPLFETDKNAKTLTLAELYGTVQSAVWSELKRGGEIEPLRRNLQREHLRRMQAALRGGAPLPPDALALTRLQARALANDLRSAAARPGLTVETRAHLEDSLSGLSEALRASMQRN